jgi:hypothetical protein
MLPNAVCTKTKLVFQVYLRSLSKHYWAKPPTGGFAFLAGLLCVDSRTVMSKHPGTGISL